MTTLHWTKIDPDGPGLHAPKREGDVGWDLEAAADVLLTPNQQLDVPTNIRVQLPPGCWGEIRARSSIARLGLQVDAGVIDNGYTGPIFVLLRNMNRRPEDNTATDWLGRVRIEKGMRIAQLVIHQMVPIEAAELDELPHDPRRGELAFGSTGGLAAAKPVQVMPEIRLSHYLVKRAPWGGRIWELLAEDGKRVASSPGSYGDTSSALKAARKDRGDRGLPESLELKVDSSLP